MKHDVDQQDEEDEEDDDPRDHQTEVAYAAAELGLRWPRGQALGDRAESGISPRAHDDGTGHSGLHGGAQKDTVAPVADRVLPHREIIRGFRDGHGLAGERGLAHMQVLCLQQAGVGRHQICGVQPDDVLRNQRGDRQVLLPPIAGNGGHRRDLLLNLLHRMARLELHEKPRSPPEG
jgi:hypothetical protein